MFEDMVKNPGQLVRGGRDRLRGAFAGPQPPIITAQGRLGAPQRLRRQAQHLRRAAVAFEGLAAQHLAPRDVVVRSQAQPRGEVLLGGPLAHIRADFRQEHLGTARLQALRWPSDPRPESDTSRPARQTPGRSWHGSWAWESGPNGGGGVLVRSA